MDAFGWPISKVHLAGGLPSQQSGMISNLLTLQVGVVLCAAHALFGPAIGGVFEEGRGVRLSQAGISDVWWWWWGRVILLPYFSLAVELPWLLVLLGCQKRLHLDVGPLFQVLASGWLGDDDGLGAVHPGRGLGAQITVGLLPSPQLIVMLLLNVLLSDVQIKNLKQRRRLRCR